MSDETGQGIRARRQKVKRPGDYVGAIFGCLLVLVAINIYPLWQPHTAGIVTEAWPRTLWAANLSLVAQVAGSFLLLFWRPRWLANLFELAFAVLGLLSVAVFFAVFPLDFSLVVGEWLNTLMRIILIVGIAGAAIGVVVNLVRFIAFSWKGE
jgi:hypothetical protein